MWIYTLDGFFSAVQDKQDSSRMVVRSRIKEDLEKMIARLPLEPGQERPEILAWVGTDYAFRVFIDRSLWVAYVQQAAEGIDYSNFKAAAIPHGDYQRSRAYHRVWAVMADYQKQVNGNEADAGLNRT